MTATVSISNSIPGTTGGDERYLFPATLGVTAFSTVTFIGTSIAQATFTSGGHTYQITYLGSNLAAVGTTDISGTIQSIVLKDLAAPTVTIESAANTSGVTVTSAANLSYNSFLSGSPVAITGSAGDDLLFSNDAGGSIFTGGAGNDTFEFVAGQSLAGDQIYGAKVAQKGSAAIGEINVLQFEGYQSIITSAAFDARGATIYDIGTVFLDQNSYVSFNWSQFGSGLIAKDTTFYNSIYGGSFSIYNDTPSVTTTIDTRSFTFNMYFGPSSASWNSFGTVTINGSAATAAMVVYASFRVAETIQTGAGNDLLYAYSNDLIDAGGGFNEVIEQSSGVTLALGSTNLAHVQELVLAGGTNIVSVAAADTDFTYIYGGSGTNTLTLGAGGGYLFSTGGTNHMYGGAGTDVFIGNAGVSDMHGGTGSNVYYTGAADTITGAGVYNTDVLLVTGVTLTYGANFTNVQQVILNGGTNSVDMTGSSDFVYLYGGVGTNTMKLGAAGGYEFSTGGTNHMYGGSGGTSVFVGGVGASDMHGAGGNNLYYVGANDTVFGATATGSYNTLIELAQSVTLTLGSAGLTNVQQFILNSGTNTFDGSVATSQLIIYGGAGNDTLKGGTGNDFMYGEGGTNTFQFGPNWGNDTIGDWASGTNNIIDLTALAASGVHSLANLTQTISGGNDTVVFGTNTITLNGISTALTAASFHFA